MDFSPNVPEHKCFGSASPRRMGFGLASLGRKDSILVVLGHKDFGLVVFVQRKVEHVSLGHKDSTPVAAGLELSLALTRVDPFDMSIRVVVARVDLVATTVDLVVVKGVPTAANVHLVKA